MTLTIKEIRNEVIREFTKRGIPYEDNVIITDQKILHNSKMAPYVTCGKYRTTTYDGLGIATTKDGVVTFNKDTLNILDSTGSAPSERRFESITCTVFSVYNINDLAKARGVNAQHLLEVYVEYAMDDYLVKVM